MHTCSTRANRNRIRMVKETQTYLRENTVIGAGSNLHAYVFAVNEISHVVAVRCHHVRQLYPLAGIRIVGELRIELLDGL